MNPQIPGHEPDTHDMSTETLTDPTSPHPGPGDHDLAEEDEAAKLGDFA